jgi:hypothetical protein
MTRALHRRAGEQLIRAWSTWHQTRGISDAPYDSEAARAALYHHLFRAWDSPLHPDKVALITLKVDRMLSLAQARGCAEAALVAQALGVALPAAASSSSAGSSSQQQQQQQPEQQLSASAMATLRAGVHLVWPGSSALDQLRRVAAEALLDAPGMAMNKSNMGQVFRRQAWQARQELQDLRIEQILEETHFRQKQLLRGDVEFSLDLVQLCSSIEGAVGQQPASAAAPAGPSRPSSAGRPTLTELQQDLQLVWPEQSPEQRLQRLAAAAILLAPGQELSASHVGVIFSKEAADIWRSQRSSVLAPTAAATGWQRPKIPVLLTNMDAKKVFTCRQLSRVEWSYALDARKLRGSISSSAGSAGASSAAARRVLGLLPSGSATASGTSAAAAPSTPAAAAPRLPPQPQAAPAAPLLQPQPAAGAAGAAGAATTTVSTAVQPVALLAPGISLQQLEADGAAAQVQLISGPGSGFDAMLGHLGACSALGIDLETGRAGGLCLLQVLARQLFVLASAWRHAPSESPRLARLKLSPPASPPADHGAVCDHQQHQHQHQHQRRPARRRARARRHLRARLGAGGAAGGGEHAGPAVAAAAGRQRHQGAARRPAGGWGGCSGWRAGLRWQLTTTKAARRAVLFCRQIALLPALPQDSRVLAEQFGVQLGGVLDTQVCHGLAALAASGSAAHAATARIGLSALLAAHGYRHGSKEEVQAMMRDNPRWVGWRAVSSCGLIQHRAHGATCPAAPPPRHHACCALTHPRPCAQPLQAVGAGAPAATHAAALCSRRRALPAAPCQQAAGGPAAGV